MRRCRLLPAVLWLASTRCEGAALPKGLRRPHFVRDSAPYNTTKGQPTAAAMCDGPVAGLTQIDALYLGTPDGVIRTERRIT